MSITRRAAGLVTMWRARWIVLNQPREKSKYLAATPLNGRIQAFKRLWWAEVTVLAAYAAYSERMLFRFATSPQSL
jgi:hypothetical protein